MENTNKNTKQSQLGNRVSKLGGVYLLIVVFLFPFYFIRFSIFGIPTTLVEVSIYLLFLAWLVFLIKERPSFYLVLGVLSKNKALVIGLFLFILGAFLASLFSENQRVSFGIFKAYFFDPLLFFIVFISVFDWQKVKDALKVFVLSLLSVLFLSELSLASGKLSLFFLPITYDLRFQGIFNSPNFLAMSLAPLLLVSFYFIFHSRERVLKAIWLLVFIISLIPFLFTFSYSAYLGVFVALSFVSFFYIKGKAKLILPFLIFFFGIALFFSQAWSEKMQSILNQDERSSLASRQMIWSSGIEILKDNYILGIGPGMFQKYYLEYQGRFEKPYLEWAVPYPHNLFLAFWIQNGIIGFIGFLTIIFWVFSRERSDLFPLVLSFFVYILVHGMLDTVYWKNDLALTFFFFLGVTFLLGNRVSKLEF